MKMQLFANENEKHHAHHVISAYQTVGTWHWGFSHKMKQFCFLAAVPVPEEHQDFPGGMQRDIWHEEEWTVRGLRPVRCQGLWQGKSLVSIHHWILIHFLLFGLHILIWYWRSWCWKSSKDLTMAAEIIVPMQRNEHTHGFDFVIYVCCKENVFFNNNLLLLQGKISVHSYVQVTMKGSSL